MNSLGFTTTFIPNGLPPTAPTAKPLERTEDGKIKTLHHPEGIEEDDIFFNEETVFNLVLDYQKNQQVETWKRIVEETIPLIDTIIRNYNFHQYDEIDALRAECTIKLSKVLMKYDPARGRCFTHFSISFKHFLISYAQKVRNKAKLVTCVEGEILEQTEAKAFIAEDVAREFKEKLYEVDTRFLEDDQLNALKYLVNYFLLEGFGTSKTKLCHTLVTTHNLTQDQAYTLYDYALIQMRSVLYDFYTPHYSDVNILRMSRRWSVLPELAELIGIENFTKLAHIFSGITVTFPTPKDIARLRTEKNILERAEVDPSYESLHVLGSSSGSNEGNSVYGRLGKAAINGHHETIPLYREELALRREYEGYVDREEAF